MWNIDKINDDVKGMLSEYRYEHSLMVAKCAKDLAIHYNLDSDKAYITGLIHDIAKEFTDTENNYYIEKYNIDKKFLTNEYKPVLHGIVGSYYVKEKYNMDDEICNSIKYHSLGNVDMTLFNKIILISDKIGRNNADPKLIELAYTNIDEALVYFFEWLKNKFENSGRKVNQETLDVLQKLKKML